MLALALLAIALVSLLAVRSHSVAGARRTLLLRSAQRLAFDLAGQIEAGVFDEPEVGRVEYGVYIDNRERYRKAGNYTVPRIEYPSYPENEDEACYPPGLKFEWEITEDSQPAEVIPGNPSLSGDDVQKRYRDRWDKADKRQQELENRDPKAGLGDVAGAASKASGSTTSGTEEDPLSKEEEEEKTEEWRTLTVWVRADTTRKPEDILFELERRFLWTYPDRQRRAEEGDLGGLGGEGSGSANGGNGNAGGNSRASVGNGGDK